MAIGVGNFSKKKGNNDAQLLQLAGMAGGALIGGPAGVGIGAQVGGLAGGMMQKPETQTPNIEANAMLRRQQTLSDQNPLMQIRESIDSLKYLPDPALRQEIGKPLLLADFSARGKKLPGSV